jgi:UDP-glucose 4-epimerase
VRVLLVGGGGLLGAHLAPKLVAAGHEVAICDTLVGCIGPRTTKGFRLFVANATDRNALVQPFSAFKPEIVFISLAHNYTKTTVYKAFIDSKLVLNSANAIASLLGSGVKHVYFCSTSEVYGGPQTKRPIKESRKIDLSATAHGAAKLAAEKILAFKCRELGIGCTTFRIFDMFGPRVMFCARTGIVNFLIDAFMRSEVIGLVGSKKLRDFIHAEDVAEACIRVMETGFSGTVNIGSGVGTSLEAIVKALSENMEVRQAPVFIPRSRNEVFSAVADTTLLSSMIPDWKPEAEVMGELPTLIDFRSQEMSRTKDSPAPDLNTIRSSASV